MIRSQTMRDRIFKDFRFYESKQDTHKIRQAQFQKIHGNRQDNKIRKKKQAKFINYTYSSNMNQLSRGYARIDKPYKQTYERKKKNMNHSYIKTNPVLLIYEPYPKTPKIRNHDHKYFGSSTINELKYQLPVCRVISPAYKKYWSQTGFSQSLELKPKFRQFMNSKNMQQTIQYTAANHFMEKLTDKIGHSYYDQ